MTHRSDSRKTTFSDPADVVIVAYNRKPMVLRALPQLLACPWIADVIVVDNASDDQLCDEGRRRFPQAVWLQMPANIGCSAWNYGIGRAASDLALILDDDCLPDPESLRRAILRMVANPSVGLVAFNIINHFSRLSEWKQLEHLDGRLGWANAIGACMLVRRRAFLSVGGYRDFFLCFNDLDLVFAFWEAGYRVIYDAGLMAWHFQPSRGPKKRRIYFEMRNLVWTLRGRLPAALVALILMKFSAGLLWDNFSPEGLKDVARGLRDGLSERPQPAVQGDRSGLPPRIRRLFYRNFLFGGRWRNLGGGNRSRSSRREDSGRSPWGEPSQSGADS